MHLGADGTPPSAVRARTPGWRDPRLWIGVAIVAVSVVVGARVLAAADDTVAVWAVADDVGVGDELTEDVLVSRRVNFADDADLDRYFLVADELPGELTTLRTIGAGELLPRSAVGDRDDADTTEISLELPPGSVPPSVRPGAVIDIYLVPPPTQSGGKKPAYDPTSPALSAATVVEVPSSADAFGTSGLQQVVVAVPRDDVAPYVERLAAVDNPTVVVARN